MPPAAPGRISGVVQSQTGEPLVSAAIAIRAERDSALAGGALTDRAGHFRIEGLPLGRYYVHVSLRSYTAHTISGVELTAASPAADLGL